MGPFGHAQQNADHGGLMLLAEVCEEVSRAAAVQLTCRCALFIEPYE